jgi:hypothetical protein
METPTRAEQIADAHRDLEAAHRYELLAELADTEQDRAECIQRAVECRAIAHRKMRATA